MTLLLRDVTLRDGLQDEDPIDTAAKLGLFEAIVAAGIRELELTSFVRPDRVPALADAEALCAATADAAVVRWGLVLNPRGVTRALAAGITDLQVVISVSEAHHRENAGQGVAAAVADLGSIVEQAGEAGARVELTLATAFGCPFTGPVAPDAVVALAEAALAAGVGSLGLADTIGTAVPTEVGPLVARVVALGGGPVGVHLHDTRGLAIVNALTAVESGASRVDGSVGGLGGCPFAPGATGNLPLEDLAHALEAMGVPTGTDVDGLIEAGRLACELTGRTVASHVGVAGRRFAGTPYADGP
jgi:hydroxymethylglutaryl-CoA lyase